MLPRTFKALLYVVFFLHPLESFSVDNLHWDETLSSSYVLSENESISDARIIVLNNIRVEAVNRSGVYVEGIFRLNNDQLQESIKSIHGGIVEFSEVEENISIDGFGRVKIDVKARVVVDRKSFYDAAGRIFENDRLIEEVNLLTKRNKYLREILINYDNSFCCKLLYYHAC